MAHYRTQYQIIAHHDDGRIFEVGFTSRKSRTGLVETIRRRAEKFLAVSGIAEDAHYFPTADRAIKVEGWIVRFSGKTLHETQQTVA